jgi:hypothetical protein
LARSSLRYVLPLAGLLFMASPSAAELDNTPLGETPLTEFANLSRGHQTFYVLGALEVMVSLGMRCTSDYTVGQAEDMLRAYARLGKVPLRTPFPKALFALMRHEFGCRVQPTVPAGSRNLS